jgi:hypothetical protein
MQKLYINEIEKEATDPKTHRVCRDVDYRIILL